MKMVWIMICCLALSGCACQARRDRVRPLISERCLQGETERGYGSMFQIRRGSRYALVTAAHVVEGRRPVLPVAVAEIVMRGDYLELRLQSRLPNLRVLSIGPAPEPGDKLTACGWAIPEIEPGVVVSGPLTQEWRVVEGVCTAPGHMTGQVRGGMSGGPVMDASGRVVGVISCTLPEVGVVRYECMTDRQ